MLPVADFCYRGIFSAIGSFFPLPSLDLCFHFMRQKIKFFEFLPNFSEFSSKKNNFRLKNSTFFKKSGSNNRNPVAETCYW